MHARSLGSRQEAQELLEVLLLASSILERPCVFRDMMAGYERMGETRALS